MKTREDLLAEIEELRERCEIYRAEREAARDRAEDRSRKLAESMGLRLTGKEKRA